MEQLGKKTIKDMFIATISTLKNSIKHSSETAYLILFTIYISFFILRKVNWDLSLTNALTTALAICLSITMWCAALYLFVTLADGFKLWKRWSPLVILGTAIGSLTLFAGLNMAQDAFNWGMDIYFCLMAYGKNYKKILRCVLIACIITLIIAAIGMPIGYSHDRPKPENDSPGHSLGINYPNTWGYLVFLGMLVFWYLFLKKQPIITFVFFWLISAFMYFYISCRTIALLTIGFPFLALYVWWWDKKTKNIKSKRKLSIWGILLISVPILCYLLTVMLGLNMKWVHKNFYNTNLATVAMRFVQSGICFSAYGFPLIGHSIKTDFSVVAVLNGSVEYLYVMDSSYGSYTIMRGMIWMTLCLVWLTIAMFKAWRNRDNALIVCGIFLCTFALMERPGLDLWYNFLLAYPLASIAVKEAINTEQTQNDVGQTSVEEIGCIPIDNSVWEEFNKETKE